MADRVLGIYGFNEGDYEAGMVAADGIGIGGGDVRVNAVVHSNVVSFVFGVTSYIASLAIEEITDALHHGVECCGEGVFGFP